MKPKILIPLFFFSQLVLAAIQVPYLSGPVVDEVGLLSNSQKEKLGGLLRELEASGRAQMAVLIVPTLGENDIESYSVAVMEQWKLGTKGKDQGLLLVIAANDRKMRLEVGYGLEGDIPDAYAKRFLDDDLRPFFREQRFSDGIEVVIRKVAAILKVELTGNPPARRRGGQQGVSIGFFLLVFFFMISGRFPILRRRGDAGAAATSAAEVGAVGAAGAAEEAAAALAGAGEVRAEEGRLHHGRQVVSFGNGFTKDCRGD